VGLGRYEWLTAGCLICDKSLTEGVKPVYPADQILWEFILKVVQLELEGASAGIS
jgi:hypothetical protein